MNAFSIGRRIKKYRQLKGLTQKELSEIIGRAESSVQKYEADKVEIPLGVLSKIAKALDVSVDILSRSEEKITDPIVSLINRLVELTEIDLLKWQKEYLEDIQQDSKTYFGYKHKMGKREFLNQGANDNEELEDLYLLGGLENDQYFLTKIKAKEKYNLYGFHSSAIASDSSLVHFGSSETYPEVKKLYLSAKLNAEGKNSVYSFLDRAKNYE